MADRSAPFADQDEGPDRTVTLWRKQVERSKKAQEKWGRKADKILKRYRAEDGDGKGGKAKARYNVLWSNVQTLAPALYARSPKAVVQRTFRDADPIGRIACRILERALQYQIDAGSLHETVKLCVLDRLLPGRGTCWLRYEPTIEPAGSPEAEETDDTGAVDPDPVLEKIVREMVHVDYVHWKDFFHEPGRVWSEVGWVGRRTFMDREALTKRFDELGATVPLTAGPDQSDDDGKKSSQDQDDGKAVVYEIWDRSRREVLWIADGCDQVLDRIADPYKLERFFPCPKPLFSSMTTDSLIPVPDSEQYKPQADEMDTLTARIDNVVSAIQAKGVYNLNFPELVKLMQENELSLIPVEDWASFASAGGMKGAVDFLPIDVFAKVLESLYAARKEVKAEIYEVSGLSDVLRGQGDADETATGVRTKGRFATLRLKDAQDEVARFVRDIVRMIAEIMCELFQATTLADLSAANQMEDLRVDVPAPPPMLGHNGGPPMGGPPMPPQRAPMGAGPGMMQ